jgi:hypothetical protein
MMLSYITKRYTPIIWARSVNTIVNGPELNNSQKFLVKKNFSRKMFFSGVQKIFLYKFLISALCKNMD